MTRHEPHDFVPAVRLAFPDKVQVSVQQIDPMVPTGEHDIPVVGSPIGGVIDIVGGEVFDPIGCALNTQKRCAEMSGQQLYAPVRAAG